MRNLRPFLLIFAIAAAIPVASNATIQTERAQIAISITITVTAPVGVALPSHAGDDEAVTGRSGIVASLQLDPKERPNKHYAAENLVFDTHNAVAQNQGSIGVQAEVTPNPSGTMLYGNNCQGTSPTSGQCGSVAITQTSGTTEVYHCIYEVVIDTTEASWTLDNGLYTDFEPQGSGSGDIPGGDVAYNGYLSTGTPKPTATPFIVYSDGAAWVSFAANADAATYCVDLTVTIPASTAVGTYGSQAVYTLYY